MFLQFDLVISLLGISLKKIKERQSNFTKIKAAVRLLIMQSDEGTRPNMHIHDRNECLLAHLHGWTDDDAH